MSDRKSTQKLQPSFDHRLSTGIAGLDIILHGGLLPGSFYMVEGAAGTGKTTFGLQFAIESIRSGERALFVSMAEGTRKLQQVARSHGWSTEGIDFLEIVASPTLGDVDEEERYLLFQPSEVELTQTVRMIADAINKGGFTRVVIDSLAELRLMAQTGLWYRRDMAALRRALQNTDATVMLLDVPATGDMATRTLMDGLIRLEQASPAYGTSHRRLEVEKARAQTYIGGFHDFLIETGGIRVFPRLVPTLRGVREERWEVKSGIAELDVLLGGGVTAGSSTLLLGSPGVGKSSLIAQYARETARGGDRAAMFAFDESQETVLMRAASLGMDLKKFVDEGRILIEEVDPGLVTPGQFAERIRDLVEHRGIRLVGIDSLNGYVHAMPSETDLVVHLHELLAYLANRRVVSFLVMTQTGLVGTADVPVNTSYLIDNIILMRFFEAMGETRKAMSVVKKRSGPHESTIREFRLGPDGIRLGEPLVQFQGVLTGVPTFTGPSGQLLKRNHGETRRKR